MSLILKCPMCGRDTTKYIEYINGFNRNIYNCPNCNWTNRYNHAITTESITAIDNYPSGIYYTPNITGGLQNAR